MAKQNRFAQVAGGLLDKVLEESISLNGEQSAAKEEYEIAKKALNDQINHIEKGRREAIRAIDEKAQEKKSEIAERIKNLKAAYHSELIRLGVKEEDIPLVERDVVKTVDGVAKSALGSIGRFGRYIKAGLNS